MENKVKNSELLLKTLAMGFLGFITIMFMENPQEVINGIIKSLF